MKTDLIKYAFSAGEVSPTFYGRTDLEQYDLAVAQAQNFFVDYQGGLASRPGFEFVDYILHDDKDVKTFSFQFAPEVADTYLIMMGEGYIRFVQDGEYVLENEKTITAITNAVQPVITAPSHGYATGNWVRIYGVNGPSVLNGRTYVVQVLDASRFTLLPLYNETSSTAGEPAYSGGGTVARVYTLSSPYLAKDLADLNVRQDRNAVFLTSFYHPPRQLVRRGHASWALETIQFGNNIYVPLITGYSASKAQKPEDETAGVAFAVTAVNTDDEEGLPSTPYLVRNIVDYAAERGSVRINWNAFQNIDRYNVYRSIILPRQEDLTRGERLGYVGTVMGTTFVDNNIVPDFTLSPPIQYNPFAGGAIQHINVTNAGTGYSRTTDVTISDPTGSGFRGWAIVDTNGRVTAVEISRGGSGYTNPTVVFHGGPAGVGAAGVALRSPATGNHPSVTTMFQNRRIYAATLNQPLTIWGSKPGREKNFDVSSIVNDGDSYEFDIESAQVTPIKHLIPQRTGLLIFSNAGMWQLSAGGGPVTPTQALADPQFYQGCSDVPPISIDADLLFISERGTTVRLLAYNDVLKAFTGQDVSILANHLFTEDKQIIDWVYAQEPYRLVHGVRRDGVMVQFTIVKEQEVYAWTRATTQGYFEQVTSLQEGQYDRLYTVVRRFVNGTWRKYLERQSLRNFEHIEDAVCADSALTNRPEMPKANLTVDGTTVRASALVFRSQHFGWVLRCNGAKARITGVYNQETVFVEWVRPYTKTVPETNIPAMVPAGEWTLDPEIREVRGLGHLEGMEVAVLADGNVVKGMKVENGGITLPYPASRITVGLGYRCLLQTLPPASMDVVLEHRRKKIHAAYSRILATRGLKYGKTLDNLYEVPERTVEHMGAAIVEQDGIQGVLISADWDINGQTYIVQDNPLPATILGLVLDGDFGDS